MSFKSKEIKGIYNKIISNDYLLGKYLLHLSYAFEAAGIVVGYNFSDYVYSWEANRVLNILKYGLHNREEDRRPLKNGDFEDCYFIYIPRKDELYAYYNGDEFIKKVKRYAAEVTQYFNKSEEVFDDYFNPVSIDDFSLEIPENADVRKIVDDYFMWY